MFECCGLTFHSLDSYDDHYKEYSGYSEHEGMRILTLIRDIKLWMWMSE